MKQLAPVDAGVKTDMLLEAAGLVIGRQIATPDMLQRRVRCGFATAGQLLELLEQAGVVGPPAGGRSRPVLVATADKEAALAQLRALTRQAPSPADRVCQGCQRGKVPGHYLCRTCWFALPPDSRSALNRRDNAGLAARRLSDLYDQLQHGVALAEVRVPA